MNNLSFVIVLLLDTEADGTLHTVEIVVKSGGRIHEKRGRDTQKIESFCKKILKKIFYGFNSYLSFKQTQGRGIVFRNL